MTYTVTEHLTTFDFWGGAIYTVTHMTLEQLEQVEDFLEIDNQGEYYTKTEINDLFWFESDTIAQWLGYNNFDELEEHNKQEEE